MYACGGDRPPPQKQNVLRVDWGLTIERTVSQQAIYAQDGRQKRTHDTDEVDRKTFVFFAALCGRSGLIGSERKAGRWCCELEGEQREGPQQARRMCVEYR